MNILNLVFSFTTGGIENLLVDTMNGWNDLNGKMFLCVINDDFNYELIKKIEDTEKVILLQREPKGSKLSYAKKLQLIIQTHEIELVHCHSINAMKFLLFSSLLGVRLNYKRFITIHNVTLVPNFSLTEKMILKVFCQHIFGVSKAVLGEIKEVIDHPTRVSLLYNGVDGNKYDYNKPKRNDNEIRIANVARIFPAMKGQDLLIEAIAILKIEFPNIKCYLAGEPPANHPEYLEMLKKQALVMGVAERIHFVGNCNDVPGFLKNIDIFVLPSRYEGFGIAVIEAILAQCEVVASNLDGPREIIGNDELGNLTVPGDIDSLVKGIRKCIITPVQNLSNRKEKCLASYAIDTYIANLSKAYNEDI